MYAGTESLATILRRQGSLVTPDYPLKETLSVNRRQVVDETSNRVCVGTNRHLLDVSEALKLSQEKISQARGEKLKATLAPRPVAACNTPKEVPPSIPLIAEKRKASSGHRLNKFVRRLHDMLQAEGNAGIVEWRRGLLVLYSNEAFTKQLLPKYFATRNFKTFRRQLNYYGFVHVRSFSTTGSSPTALWVNRSLASESTDDAASVLKLKRVEPCDTAKTAEGRRQRKELAKHTVEQDIGVSAKALQLEQLRSMALRGGDAFVPSLTPAGLQETKAEMPLPREVHIVSDSASVEKKEQVTASDGAEQQLLPPSSSDDRESKSAANVLLMLSRA